MLIVFVFYQFFFRKSSIVRLLFRFFEPDSGKILIAGKDIKSLDIESLRKSIAVVPQVSLSQLVYTNNCKAMSLERILLSRLFICIRFY